MDAKDLNHDVMFNDINIEEHLRIRNFHTKRKEVNLWCSEITMQLAFGMVQMTHGRTTFGRHLNLLLFSDTTTALQERIQQLEDRLDNALASDTNTAILARIQALEDRVEASLATGTTGSNTNAAVQQQERIEFLEEIRDLYEQRISTLRGQFESG